jgi:flagellar basal-body rod modification protein FlgD
MVDPVNNSGARPGSLAEAAGAGGNGALGQEAFLKLLVAQLQNQDPLNPQDNYEFVAQLAQFSSLEQTIGINDRLDQLALQSQGLQNTETVSLVGKEVTVKGNIVTLDGQGTKVPISFTTEDKSTSSEIVIKDQNGRTVRTLRMGPHSAGLIKVTWDGRDDTGLAQPAGAYKVTASAKNGDDAPVIVSQQSTGSVQSVSFEKGFPVLTLDNGMSVPVSDLVRVAPPTNP